MESPLQALEFSLKIQGVTGTCRLIDSFRETIGSVRVEFLKAGSLRFSSLLKQNRDVTEGCSQVDGSVSACVRLPPLRESGPCIYGLHIDLWSQVV